MRNIRKSVASLSVLAILSSLVVSTTAFAYNDVPSTQYYYDAVMGLKGMGILDSTKTNFEPGRNLQRQEAAKLVVEATALSADVPAQPHFTDVATTLWSYASVETAYANGVVKGYTHKPGYFGPVDPVTREQFVKMVVEAFDMPEYLPVTPTFLDVNSSMWSYPYVETAKRYEVVNGRADGSFAPFANINRADAAVMIWQALDAEIEEEEPCGDETCPLPEEEEAGAIAMSLSDENPDSVIVPVGATRVPYLVFEVTGKGTIKGITFERFGAGSASDFDGVYLYDGEKRLTTARTVNTSSNQVTFNGLNMAIDGTRTLTLAADISTNTAIASNVNAFRVKSVDSAAVTTFAGVQGELMGFSSVSVGQIIITKTGSLTNPKVGEKDVKIAEFQLAAGSQEAIKVDSITLYQVGSLGGKDLTNFRLFQGSTEVAKAAMVEDNDTIVLLFPEPYRLDKGDTRNFELRADIGAGARDNDTIRIYLDNDADLDAVGEVYNFGVIVNRNGYDNGANDGTDASWSEVEGGQLTFSFQGPSVQDYATNMKDVQLAKYEVAAQNNLEIRDLQITLTAPASAAGGLTNAGTAPNYTDIKVWLGGSVIAGPVDVASAGSDTTQTLTFTDVWSLNAGEAKTMIITADIANFVPAGNETIKADLVLPFGASKVKNLENNQYVANTDIVPSTTVIGNTHKVQAGDASMSVAGTPTAQNYVNGSQDVSLTGVRIQAGQGKDIYLKSLKVTAVGANGCASETDCVQTVMLYDGNTQLGLSKSLTSSADPTAVFTNLNLKIDKGTTKTLTVKTKLNTLSSVPGGTTIHVDVAAISDITLQDVDGNSITVSGTVTGPTHTIVGTGSISGVASTTNIGTSDARIVTADTMGVPLAQFRFDATTESLKLAKVRLTLPQNSAQEVNSLYLFDGATMVAGPVTPNAASNPAIADFNTFSSEFTIPANGNKVLTVKADLNPASETGGAVSGTPIFVTLDYDTNFEARSAAGGNTVLTALTSGSDLVGSTVTIRKTKPTVTKVDLPTTFTSGSQQIYSVNVKADEKGDLALKQLSFEINLNGGAFDMSDFALLKGGSDISDSLAIYDSAGNDLTAGTLNLLSANDTVRVIFDSEDIVEAGQNITYTLRATFAGVDAGEAVTTRLMGDTTLAGAVDALEFIFGGKTYQRSYQVIDDSSNGQVLLEDAAGTQSTSNYNFIWSDLAASPHSFEYDNSFDWINGFQVKNFALESQVKSRSN